MEQLLKDSLAAKYFCKKLIKSLKETGLVREIYTFVDASKIVACVDTWKARDKAIEDVQNKEKNNDDQPTMNNKNVGNYSSDPDARYGAKGKNDIWLGYKRHVAVDAHQGLITKVALTPANVHDGVAFKHVSWNRWFIISKG